MKGAALVTGATRRIGLAIATKLAADGYAVAFHASPRSLQQGEIEIGRLKAAGAQACLVVGDLTNPEICHDIIDEAAKTLGPLTLLVSSAAVFEPDGVDQIDIARWERHFAINLRAPVILGQRFALQAAANRDASIVNVIDQRVLRPTPLFFSYTLSKSALWTATRTMAQGLAPRGIRVNAVGPGPVFPNDEHGDEGFEKEARNVPLQHAIAPEDVADAVLYLARARGVTGQMIAVDAGQHLAWRTPDIIE